MRQPSGRFVLRVSPELHLRLRDRARVEGISLNSLCGRLLEGAVLTSAGRATPAAGSSLDPALLEGIAREWPEDLIGVVLFGSAARGNTTKESDINLLIVLRPSTRIERSLYDRWDRVARSSGQPPVKRVSPQFVALPVAATDAGGIWLEVAREGIVLSDRDGRLARFLIELRDFVAAGNVSRKTVHGHPYWVRGGRNP